MSQANSDDKKIPNAYTCQRVIVRCVNNPRNKKKDKSVEKNGQNFLTDLFVCFFKFFYCGKNTLYEVYLPNKLLSAQYNVGYRYSVLQQICRIHISCLTKSLFP